MNILVYTRSAWDDRNAVGNTYSNWFDGECWGNDVFYDFYMRSAKPDNNVCKNYYRVTVNDLIKNFFNKEKIGKQFVYEKSTEENSQTVCSNVSENKMINFLHDNSSNILYTLMERLCYHGSWINKRFINYLKEINPDIFFATAADNGMLFKMIQAVKQYTNAKIILFIADDVYGKYCSLPFYRRRLLKRNFCGIINHADYLYGASEVLCREYKKIFNRDINVLYKGCTFINKNLKKDDNIIKMVYAGNMYRGRDDVLNLLGENLLRVKKYGLNARLDIYSNAEKSKELLAKIEKKDISFFRGSHPYEEIKKIFSEADIVLHVESFEQKNIDTVRYSFSTKIIDCLQSGSVLMVIGPKGIASVEYARTIPGAIVIDDLDNLERELLKLKDFDFDSAAESIRKFAIEKHDIHNVQENLRKDFCSICSKC